MNVPNYTRLPGRGRTWAGRAHLWLGPDHVLSVQSLGYTESYRRFFFADTQAIVAGKTHTGKIWNCVWGSFVAFFGLLAISQTDVASIVLWSIAAALAVPLVINLALGPTCACYVRTAVQTERLTAISRMSAARRLIDLLRPRIAAAQGEISRDELLAAFDRAQGFATPASAAPESSGEPPVIG